MFRVPIVLCLSEFTYFKSKVTSFISPILSYLVYAYGAVNAWVFGSGKGPSFFVPGKFSVFILVLVYHLWLWFKRRASFLQQSSFFKFNQFYCICKTPNASYQCLNAGCGRHVFQWIECDVWKGGPTRRSTKSGMKHISFIVRIHEQSGCAEIANKQFGGLSRTGN